MKIAVLSDIHSNVFALDAVIEDLKNHSVDLKPLTVSGYILI